MEQVMLITMRVPRAYQDDARDVLMNSHLNKNDLRERLSRMLVEMNAEGIPAEVVIEDTERQEMVNETYLQRKSMDLVK